MKIIMIKRKKYDQESLKESKPMKILRIKAKNMTKKVEDK